MLPTPFLELSVFSTGEAGLISVVLDPAFAVNHYIYLHYTIPNGPYHNRISRFTASGDVVLASSEKIVLDLDPLSYADQHNGGAMAFGADGKLYVCIGDSENPIAAQNLDTYLGKLLRINPDGSIPEGNPFLTGSEQKKRIWAYGLRNPYSLSVQPVTGRIMVNDVGEGSWEEINDVTTGGGNFGWPQAEGFSTNPTFQNPVFAYDHTNARCAITGGVFFNPSTTAYPASFQGIYFFQDFCTSMIRGLDLTQNPASPTVFGQNLPGQPIRLSVGLDGNLYFLSRGNSALYKIIYTTNSTPEIVSQPVALTVSEGKTARFMAIATGTAPLSFQWQKDTVDILGATAATYQIDSAAVADSGDYRVRILNPFGTVTSNQASLTVTIPNPITVTIDTPVNHTIYRAGDTITFSGSARSSILGVLPDSNFVWTVVFHHNTHYHDGPPIATKVSHGQFTIANQGETSANVHYELVLTVTDSTGRVNATSVDIDPHLAVVSTKTNRPGLELALNGPLFASPYSQSFVSGIKLTLSAPASQTLNGIAYSFKEWVNGPSPDGIIAVPDTNYTYQANYIMQPCLSSNGLTTSAIKDTLATLNWQLPGATDDTNFKLRWRPEGDTVWVIVDSLAITNESGSYTLSRLTSATSYEWQIQSLCSVADSSIFSSSAFFQTLGICTTVKSGEWTDPSVWSCNHIPTKTDFVRLRHDVVIPANYTANCLSIKYELPVLLTWSTGAQLLLGQ